MIAQILKSIVSVIFLGVFLLIAGMYDYMTMYSYLYLVTFETVKIDGLFANAFYIAVLLSVIFFNLDYRNVRHSVASFMPSAVALIAYAVAYNNHGLTVMGAPDWMFPALGWVFDMAPVVLLIDLVLGIWIYIRKR